MSNNIFPFLDNMDYLDENGQGIPDRYLDDKISPLHVLISEYKEMWENKVPTGLQIQFMKNQWAMGFGGLRSMHPINVPELLQIQSKIWQYLHRNPIRPEDFDLLLPNFLSNGNIVKKIQTNIALWAARGFTSDEELEEYWMWLIGYSNEKFRLVDSAKSSVTFFKRKHGGLGGDHRWSYHC